MERTLKESPEITDKLTEKISHSQLGVKLGHFIENELDTVLTTIKSKKVTGLDEILPVVWKTRKFGNIVFRLCNAV